MDISSFILGLKMGGNGGGANNFVTGTFTAATGANDVSTGYTGNGYPIMLAITVEGGAHNPANTAWYDLIQRYNIGEVLLTKSVFNSTPDYNDTANDTYVDLVFYKNSTTTPSTYGRTSQNDTKILSQQSPTNTEAFSVLRMKNKSTFSYWGENISAYGFTNGITYRYWIVYSE